MSGPESFPTAKAEYVPNFIRNIFEQILGYLSCKMLKLQSRIMCFQRLGDEAFDNIMAEYTKYSWQLVNK